MSKTSVFSSTYLPPIEWYVEYLDTEEVLIDRFEHYVKQSYRNRAHICGAQGLQRLIVPVKRKNHMPMNEVQLANDFPWKTEHLRSLQAAYRNSPYFEYYEHHFAEFYYQSIETLVDLNSKFHQKIMIMLGIEDRAHYSEEYVDQFNNDFRNQIHPKQSNSSLTFPEYPQVFQERHGFVANLSIIDLLFNLGPESLGYLKSCIRR